ncbi:pyrroline-5-carboxylate reductase [Ereboglobus sp. PH5-10]|uniref:pyrroline-5-carboxylate reductase n=1 Tax=Ereboglobus sp. PH5-10 TaxID=2940629 RepID=UPI002404F097|nr:pyrroline-5-carboxylate reductase [Ereboglobus sp. PH5-10]MDF9826646.1 pyrroline-5-carboxylate reductase [Ereboglobus sp. PH5-10]
MNHISFLGAGRMASAIVTGLINKGARTPAQIACLGSATDTTAADLAARTGIAATNNLETLLAGAGTVVLACKPQQLAQLDASLAGLTRGKLIISILAGKRLARLAQTFPNARNIVRAMPNTPGQIGAGVTAWASLSPLAETDRANIDQVLGSLGRVVAVGEAQLDAVTGLSGSGPAYVFEFAAALRDAGVAAGLERDSAKQLAIETLLGSAKLLAQSSEDAETLRDQVTSPNGTTYAGLQRMAARDFRGIIKETVLAATARSEELSRD